MFTFDAQSVMAALGTVAAGTRSDVLLNMTSVSVSLLAFGERTGLSRPHALAQFIAQVGHESGGFVYDKELWGPTPAQSGYDVRSDLGNTPARDGDGKLYMGRSAIQITGKANYGTFTRWARDLDPAAPDFVANPDLVLTDPWEGLAPIWYWATRVGGRYVDAGDIEMITRQINGGLNGYDDRLARYTRVALHLNGFAPQDVRGFQAKVGLTVDGVAGPRTRAALHQTLVLQPTSILLPAPVQPVPVLTLEARVVDLEARVTLIEQSR